MSLNLSRVRDSVSGLPFAALYAAFPSLTFCILVFMICPYPQTLCGGVLSLSLPREESAQTALSHRERGRDGPKGGGRESAGTRTWEAGGRERREQSKGRVGCVRRKRVARGGGRSLC